MLTLPSRHYLFTMVFSKEARAMALAEKFERNTRMTDKTAWQDEKDFTLDVPVNLQLNGYMEKEKKLMFQMRTSYGFRCNLLVRRHETVFCE